MKKLVLLLIFLVITTLCSAVIINVPADYNTIQEGIDAAIDYDTVLVDTGTYVENINFNGKNITVASKFLTTQDTIYISETVIDGDSSGSVVTFDKGEDTLSVLNGFTLKNGYATGHGGGISCRYSSSPSIKNIIIIKNSAYYNGGGISCYYSDPCLKNINIMENFAANHGGGIYCRNSDPTLKSVRVINNCASYGGGIYCLNSNLSFNINNRCNIYSNTANNGCGSDVFSSSNLEIIVDTFTVPNPTDYYTSPINNFTFDILNSVEDSLVNSDVYVSIYGNNSNSGISPDAPFKTINHALSKIYSDSLNTNIIYLVPGIYSPSNNGEKFPINLNNYVNIYGVEEKETIIDAENTGRVMEFINIINSSIKNMIITNGYDLYGGGISCFYYSYPNFENVTIVDNIADDSGGGILCDVNSSPNFTNVTITNNNADNLGGAICCRGGSSPSFNNCIISNNVGEYGIYVISGCPTISYSNIFNNEYGNFYNLNDSVGINITTNSNGDSCDVFYNIQMNPLFVDTANGDYHLTENSPCIDAGDPDFPLDPDSTIADMGAYYYNQGAAVDKELFESPLANIVLFPNPVNPKRQNFNIEFKLKNPDNIRIKLFNIKGQLVSTVLDQSLNSGEHNIIHSLKEVSSGIYFIKLEVNDQKSYVRKMLKID